MSKFNQKETGKEWDRRTKFQIYEDLKKINNETVLVINPDIYMRRNDPDLSFIRCFEFRYNCSVMKMDIGQFIKVIDMDLIIQMKNGIVKKLNIF